MEFCKSKIEVYAAFQNSSDVFFSFNHGLSQESEGTKDSCVPLFFQWENSEQKSVRQQRFSLVLPDLNLCHSVSTALLDRVYLCDQLSCCVGGPVLVTSRSLNNWVSGFLMILCLLGPSLSAVHAADLVIIVSDPVSVP